MTIIIIVYTYATIMLPNSNCSKITSWFPTLQGNGLTSLPSNSNYLLRDYYIKSAWNCCLSGNEKHDFVNFCGLDATIRQGCRFLDFQIFTINGQPSVAFSNKKSVHQKDTFNSIKTADIFQRINQNAFASSVVQNYNDPLILHFRFSTDIENTYNILASQIEQFLNARILPRTYSNAYNGHNLGAVDIKEFFGKIIIFVDGSKGHGYKHSKLWEYINMVSNSPFLKIVTYEEIVNNNNEYFK